MGARASVDELTAWLRIEKGEIAITGGTWLDDYVPQLQADKIIAAAKAARTGEEEEEE